MGVGDRNFVMDHRASLRERRWPLTLVVVVTAIVATLILAPPTEPIEVNVSPMASVEVAGQVGRVVPGTEIEMCLPEAMLDATVEPPLRGRDPRPRRWADRDDHLALAGRTSAGSESSGAMTDSGESCSSRPATSG